MKIGNNTFLWPGRAVSTPSALRKDVFSYANQQVKNSDRIKTPVRDAVTWAVLNPSLVYTNSHVANSSTLSMADKFAIINQDRSGMSLAEVQARLEAISTAGAQDDYTNMTDAEIYETIHNRYFTSFGNMVSHYDLTSVDTDYLLIIREQYHMELETALGKDREEKGWRSDCYSEMLGCAGMSPEEKQRHILAMYKGAGLTMSPLVYEQMYYDMRITGAIDDKTYHNLWIDLDIQIDATAMSEHYARHGSLDNFYIGDYKHVLFQGWNWDLVWDRMLERMAKDPGYTKEGRDAMTKLINSWK